MSSHPARTFRYRYWGTALRTVLLPLGDLAFGQRLTTRLAFLAKAQWWDREKLEHGRRLALAKLIGVAYREVPFYRDLFDKARVQPGEISTIEALRRVPFVTKEMLRSRYPAGTTRATGQRTYEACSSGSTGLNFCVREDPETAGWYRASFMLALEWSGWRLGEPHLQTGNSSRAKLSVG